MTKDHGQCVTDETLTDYLEGSLDPAIRAASEVHLVSCGRCRDRLAFFMRMLQPEVTAEETDALQVIAAEWDRNKIGREVPARSRSIGRWLAGIGAVAAVLVVGLVSMWLTTRRAVEPKSATEVVQLLLDENRPFETRIAGQPHRPIVRTRSASDAGVSYSVLAGEMTRLSATSHEMGRFYLLQKDFSHAIPYLEMAERETGASAAVHNDLGVAYLETGNGDQLKKAESEFLHAIRQDGLFADAIFNLAVFYERTNATAKAEAQWKRYVEVDSQSDWADEARERLQGLSR